MLWIGLYPGPILRRTEGAARRYVEMIQPLPAAEPGRTGPGGGRRAMMPIDPGTPGGATLALLPELLLTAGRWWCCWSSPGGTARRHDSRPAGGAGPRRLSSSRCSPPAGSPGAVPGAEGLPQMIALDGFRYAGDASVARHRHRGDDAVAAASWSGRASSAPEYYVLLMLATVGMMLLAGAEDLIMLFLGLEVMSVSVYVLAGLRPDPARSRPRRRSSTS